MDVRARALLVLVGVAASILTISDVRGNGPDALADALLGNDDYKIRLRAATRLGHFGGESALPSLVAALDDRHRLVRAAAAEALGRLGDARARFGLCGCRDDHDEFVRNTASAALDRLGGLGCGQVRRRLWLDVTGTEPTDPRVARHVAGVVADRVRSDASVEFDERAGNGEGIELKLRVHAVLVPAAAGEGVARVKCAINESFYRRPERALRGSATHRGELEVGPVELTPPATETYARRCVDALVPVVYETFTEFLDRTP